MRNKSFPSSHLNTSRSYFPHVSISEAFRTEGSVFCGSHCMLHINTSPSSTAFSWAMIHILTIGCWQNLPLSQYPWIYRSTGFPSHYMPRSRPDPEFHPSHQTNRRFLETKRKNMLILLLKDVPGVWEVLACLNTNRRETETDSCFEWNQSPGQRNLVWFSKGSCWD